MLHPIVPTPRSVPLRIRDGADALTCMPVSDLSSVTCYPVILAEPQVTQSRNLWRFSVSGSAVQAQVAPGLPGPTSRAPSSSLSRPWRPRVLVALATWPSPQAAASTERGGTHRTLGCRCCVLSLETDRFCVHAFPLFWAFSWLWICSALGNFYGLCFVFDFLSNYQTVFQSGCTTSHPHSTAMPTVPHPRQHP